MQGKKPAALEPLVKLNPTRLYLSVQRSRHDEEKFMERLKGQDPKFEQKNFQIRVRKTNRFENGKSFFNQPLPKTANNFAVTDHINEESKVLQDSLKTQTFEALTSEKLMELETKLAEQLANPPFSKKDNSPILVQRSRGLGKYDCWEHDLSPEEWLRNCRETPDEFHAKVPVFRDGKYVWIEAKVMDFEPSSGRFLVDLGENHKPPSKWVDRLSLYFLKESLERFQERVAQCNRFQQKAEESQKYLKAVDDVSNELVRPMPSALINSILKAVLKNKKSTSLITIEQNLLTKLMMTVRSEYLRSMKKAAYNRIQALPPSQPPKIPSKEEAPSHDQKTQFAEKLSTLKKLIPTRSKEVLKAFQTFQEKCYVHNKTNFFAFREGESRGAFTLEAFLEAQSFTFKASRDHVRSQWRDYPFRDIYHLIVKDLPQFCFDVNDTKDVNGVKKANASAFMKRIDSVFRLHLRLLIKHNVESYIKYLKSFVIVPEELPMTSVMNKPLLKLKLKLVDQKKKDKKKDFFLVFSPSFQELSDKLYEPLVELGKFISTLECFESDFRPPGTADIRVLPDATNEPLLLEARTMIENILTHGINEAKVILEKFLPFEYLMEKPADDLSKASWDEWKKEKSFSKMNALLDKETKSMRDLGFICGKETTFLMFEIDSEEVRKQLMERAFEVRRGLLRRLSSEVQKAVTKIRDKYNETQKSLTTPPEVEEGLVALTKSLKEHDIQLAGLENEVIEVGRQIELMHGYGEKLEEEQMVSFWLLKVCPLESKSALKEGRKLEEKWDVEFKNRLEIEKGEFEKEVDNLRLEVMNVIKFDDLEKVDEYALAAEKLGRLLDKASEKVEDFHRREKLFGQNPADYFALESVLQTFVPYRRMWEISFRLTSSIQNWSSTGLPKLSYKQVSQEIDNFNRDLNSLEGIFTGTREPSKVIVQMKEKLKAFETNLPLLDALLKDCMTKKPNNWKKMFETLGLKPVLQTDNLHILIQMGLKEKMEIIDEFVRRADREYALDTRLQKDIQEKLKVTKVELIQHKGSDCQLFGNADALQLMIDDHLSTLLTMKQLPYLGGLRKKVEELERKLVGMQDLISEWIKCQRAWLYLQPIFGAEDLKKSMSSEKKSFDTVDKHWRATMSLVSNDPFIFENFDWEKHKADFEASNRTLESIQKQLAKYMEAKREEFPRFYFLADEELLELLATTKEPSSVRKFLSKCFEGIDNLEFAPSGEIRAVLSAEGERMGLSRVVDPSAGEKKGCVEKWLVELEEASRESVRFHAKSAVETGKGHDDWLARFPAQITLAANAVRWAAGTEAAIERNSLREFIGEQAALLAEIVARVRSELPPLERTTVAALITLEVHAQHVLEELYRRSVSSLSDFAWTAQLRYYYVTNKQQVRVRIMTAEYDYQHEYIGNTPRLVLTPLTDRCYRTLMCAYQFFYGGAPEGPAGTGKTETVKDLAKAVAVQCVVFNCTDHINHVAMSKFFKGLAQSGAWACFDEFNRIVPEVLSVVAEQVRAIQGALKEGRQKFPFEGQNIRLVKSCAVNITMNPGYAGRAELPDNLKALFRACAMMVPDYSLIAEISLYSSGFAEAAGLATKVVGALRLASEQLSSQKHYDFGMRALKAILVANASLKRQQPNFDEARLCLQGLRDVNLPKFTAEDSLLFEAIVSDLFPSVQAPEKNFASLLSSVSEACKELKIIETPDFVGKTLQLWETVLVRHGLMLIGAAGAGKSAVLNALRVALGKQGNDVDCVVMNPKAVTGLQLYGNLDENTQAWTDGVLPSVMKTQIEEMKPGDRRWMMFDGPVDAGWIENINTLLDDNKILCLTNGQKIKMLEGMTIMFEVEDLIAASPATVSRCGMVFVSKTSVGWPAQLRRFLSFDLRPALAEVSSVLDSTLTRLLRGALQLISAQKRLPLRLNEALLAQNCLRLLAILLEDLETADERWASEAAWFSVLWGIGGLFPDPPRRDFAVWALAARSGCGLPPITDEPFGLQLDLKNRVFAEWAASSPSPTRATRLEELVVPTPDSLRSAFFFGRAMETGHHALLTGPTGTGKSLQLSSQLARFQAKEWSSLALNFSAQTSANALQKLLEARLSSRRGRKGHYGPEEGRKGVAAFFDDMSMPAREAFGAQPPLELLRMWLDQGYWFELETREKRHSAGLLLGVAMAAPESGLAAPSPRLLRHFFLFSAPEFGRASMTAIFAAVLDWHFASGSFLRSVTDLRDALVSASVELFNLVRAERALLPTPAKSHYLFSLRDVSRVFRGFAKSSPRSLGGAEEAIKLWVHESLRVYSDRLSEDRDKILFRDLLGAACKLGFDRELRRLVKHEPLIFGCFGPAANQPAGLYTELSNLEDLRRACTKALTELSESRGERISPVLFAEALEHVARMARVFATPGGHALLAGLAGLGRRTLALLAAQLCGLTVVEPELKSGYGQKEWGEDLIRALREAGLGSRGTLFLVRDSAITIDTQLEDISGLLSRGETPEWLPDDDKARLLDDAALALGLDESASQAARVEALRKKVRDGIRIGLLFSPVDAKFRKRLRAFPALVNCTTIDWFSDWPASALSEVGRGALEEWLQPEKRPVALAFFPAAHAVAAAAAKRLLSERRRELFVTPATFLTLLSAFRSVFNQRAEQLKNSLSRYEKGVAALNGAKIEVEALKVAIRELEPKLVISERETDELIARVTEERAEADSSASVCAGEEEIAMAEREDASKLKEACAADLAKVEPELEAALKELRSIKKDNINFIKSLPKPPAPIIKLFHSLCVLFNKTKKLQMIQDPNDPTKKRPDWAAGARLIMAKPEQLLSQLLEFDADAINRLPESTIAALKEICDDEMFAAEKMSKTSEDAAKIAFFIEKVVNIFGKLQVINPKRDALASAQAKLAATEASLAAKKAELQALLSLVAEREAQLAEAQRKGEDLKSEIERCKRQSVAAEKLLSGLESERISWSSNVTSLQIEEMATLGDSLLAGGFMAYLGAFPSDFRVSICAEWKSILRAKNIRFTEEFSLSSMLADELEIGGWISRFRLPNDSHSVENAVIATRAPLFPLALDPQSQANRWLKLFEKDAGLTVIKPSARAGDVEMILAGAVEGGLPVLYENLPESPDRVLVELLEAPRRLKYGKAQLRYSGRWLELHSGFRMYLTTKLARPNLAPELCIRITLLDFAATPAGLEDQLLNTIVSKEDPNSEKARQNNVREFFDLKRKQRLTEENILGFLGGKSGNLLDDAALIETLAKSKQEAKDAQTRLADTETMKKKLAATRNLYKKAAVRASQLFFCLTDLSSVEQMYAFSLDWFFELFAVAIAKEPKIRETRAQDIADGFTKLLFAKASAGIFEKDKLLFALLIYFRATLGEDLGPARALFLAGSKTLPDSPNPLSKVFSDKQWAGLEDLFKVLPNTETALNHAKSQPGLWTALISGIAPETQNFPCELGELEQLCIMRVLRPDRLIAFAQKKIEAALGKEFVEGTPFSLEAAFAETRPNSAIIFLLSPGADPLSDVFRLANVLARQAKTIDVLALGQGQEEAAQSALESATQKGKWVVLQNAHLAPKFLHRADRLLEEATLSADFRLWITSMPCDQFPVTMLQSGLKLTCEPPAGVRANLTRNLSAVNAKHFESHPKATEWKRLYFGLMIFHAVAQERRRFGSLGWNVPYEFSVTDLTISAAQLNSLLRESEELPWEALRYAIAEANYGGRVTDPMDRRLLATMLDGCVSPRALDPYHKYCELDVYIAPEDGSFAQFKAAALAYPTSDPPELFGLHPNAEITSSINRSNALMASMLALLPRASSINGKSSDDVIREKIVEFQSKLPTPFNIEYVKEQYPLSYSNSMNTVLLQELARYNGLIERIGESLGQISKAIDGLIIMTDELDEGYGKLLNNQVPDTWSQVAYPSLKPLAAWFKNFLERIAFMQKWINEGSPSVYWLSGFFFTQSFLTGTLQNYARHSKIPIDQISFSCQVIETPLNQLSAPPVGAYVHGLYFEGAQWNFENHSLAEPKPKELFTQAPVIWLKPDNVAQEETSQQYTCPLYKTSKRAGVLSTTGHSTNFVISIPLPISKEHTPQFWIKRGVAMLCDLDD